MFLVTEHEYMTCCWSWPRRHVTSLRCTGAVDQSTTRPPRQNTLHQLRSPPCLPPRRALALTGGARSCHGDAIGPGVCSRGCCHGDPGPRCSRGGGRGRWSYRRAAARVRAGAPSAPRRATHAAAGSAVRAAALLHAGGDRRDLHRAPTPRR